VSKPKILLADDSITIQKVVSLTFADRGMDVVAFSDGDAAIEHLDEENPDIVLADVHMPGINGYHVCELIRSNETTKNTPVVLLVGSFEPFDRDEAERVGANAHLTKPFTSIADVISTVDNLLAESAREREAALGPRPDTTDIDSLYERSFAETMELPEKGSVEYDIDGYDDEMIQTSYAEPDLGPVVEESLYTTDGDNDLAVPTVELEEVEADSLYAESMPTPAEPAETVEGPTQEIEAEAEEPAPEPEEEEEPVRASDPFESVAAEPPPVQEETPAADAVKFSFEETDLLELPGTPAPRPVEYTIPNPESGREIVSLSPELIDLIVQKVVDRLAEKDRADEARSMSGS
jgi:CheY-like chemotaxis protein